MYSGPLKLLAPPWPLAHGVMHFPVTGVLLFLQDFLSTFLSLSCFVMFSKDRTGDNLMVQGQDCRVDAATLYIQNLRRLLLCAHVCGLTFAWSANVQHVETAKGLNDRLRQVRFTSAIAR